MLLRDDELKERSETPPVQLDRTTGRRNRLPFLLFKEQAMMRRMFLMTLALMILVTAGDAAGSGRRRSVSRAEEIKGIIAVVSSEWVTIRTARRGDLAVRIAPETVISAGDRRLPLSALQIGDEVEARVRKGEGGLYTAIDIEIESECDAWGVVQSVSGTTLVLTTAEGELTLLIGPSTVVVLDDHVASPGALSPGMRAEVEWVRGPNGSLLALLIEVDVEMVEIDGVITHIDSTTIKVRTRKGDEVTVRLTPDTRVRIDDWQTSVAALHAGARVEIEALRGSDGTLTALRIEAEDELFEIEGVVKAAGVDSLTIQTHSGEEVTVGVPPGTIIRDEDRLRSLSDLRPGDRVEVKAHVNAAGELVAVVVEVDEDDDRFFEIEGKIVSITGSTLTVRTEHGSDVTIWLTSETIIRGHDALLDVSQLHVGDDVEIVVRRRADHSLEAVAVEIEDNDHSGDDNDTELEGYIVAVGANQITLVTEHGSVTIAVNDATVIRKNQGPGSLSDLKPGLKVEVKAVVQSDKSLLAKVIEVDDEDDGDGEDDNSIELEGSITAAGTGQITLQTSSGSVTVALNGETVIRKDDGPGSLSDLKPGVRVEVEAVVQSDKSLLAKVIEIEDEDDD